MHPWLLNGNTDWFEIGNGAISGANSWALAHSGGFFNSVTNLQQSMVHLIADAPNNMGVVD